MQSVTQQIEGFGYPLVIQVVSKLVDKERRRKDHDESRKESQFEFLTRQFDDPYAIGMPDILGYAQRQRYDYNFWIFRSESWRSRSGTFSCPSCSSWWVPSGWR